ncbi:hypothetical protein JMJ77_0000193 [Colletotrichum scovillei]|uniref:Uncharacterized protein n=1 Tax=Colletotrichum scovillei TaxID=1209932 RepID=A0A9P7RBR6_9PEZI|nr:hypothetical protein JMJ77_0000193 [Colletotrichum scovillei]KAG7071396.1 hypothetical protein JMJ76_0004269 [Colletotrichum scovillei]KAG7079612.1 hypothetical protein JMJ78_0006718 [Colletotrichum scovillei]
MINKSEETNALAKTVTTSMYSKVSCSSFLQTKCKKSSICVTASWRNRTADLLMSLGTSETLYHLANKACCPCS